MTNNNQPIDLGKFKSVFEQTTAKYKASDKNAAILNILGEAILGKISDVAMADRLEKDVKLEFSVACDLAYDLKKSILDNKAGVEELKKSISKQSLSKFSPDSIAEEFLNKLNYKFKDVNLKKRFEQAILSWLQDIRDIPELKSLMLRGDKIGGLGLSEDVFNQLYDLLMAKKEEIAKENINMPQLIADYQAREMGVEKPQAGVQEEEIDVAAKPVEAETPAEKLTGEDVTINQLLKEKDISYDELAKTEEIKKELIAEEDKAAQAAQPKPGSLAEKIEDKEEFLESREELPSPANLPSPAKPLSQPAPQSRPADMPPVKQSAPVQQMPSRPVSPPAQANMPQPLIKKSEKSARPKMDDVKFAARVYGPVDELNALTLADFRRLSKDAQQAADRIRQKIELLEEDSIEKKDAGLRALKNSPLYKIYADIMNKAIMQGKPFEQIISQRQDMSVPEFRAIMELNKSLKY